MKKNQSIQIKNICFYFCISIFLFSCKEESSSKYKKLYEEASNLYFSGPPEKAVIVLERLRLETEILYQKQSNIVIPEDVLWLTNMRLYDVYSFLQEEELREKSLSDTIKYLKVSNPTNKVKSDDILKNEIINTIREIDKSNPPKWKTQKKLLTD